MVRVLVVVEENGLCGPEAIGRLQLAQVALQTVSEAQLRDIIREDPPDIVCAEWYAAPGRLRDSARWLLRWSNYP